MTWYPRWVTKPVVVEETRLLCKIGDSYIWQQNATPKGKKIVYGETKVAGQVPRCTYLLLSHLLTRKGL